MLLLSLQNSLSTFIFKLSDWSKNLNSQRYSDISPYKARLFYLPRLSENILKSSDQVRIRNYFGYGFGSVDGVVASDTRDQRFKSSQAHIKFMSNILKRRNKEEKATQIRIQLNFTVYIFLNYPNLTFCPLTKPVVGTGTP